MITLEEIDSLSIYYDGSSRHIKDGRFVMYDLFFSKLSNCHLNQKISLEKNPRIIEQKGCFTTSRELKNPIEPDRIVELNLISVEKKKVLRLIEEIRINNNEPEFFPSLSGVYLELENRCKKLVGKFRID